MRNPSQPQDAVRVNHANENGARENETRAWEKTKTKQRAKEQDIRHWAPLQETCTKPPPGESQIPIPHYSVIPGPGAVRRRRKSWFSAKNPKNRQLKNQVVRQGG